MEECNIPENSGFTIVKNSGDSAAMVLDELLPGMIESFASSGCDVLFLAGKEPFIRKFTGFFYRLFLLIFCGIKVKTPYSPVQLWKEGLPEASGTFPENLVAAKRACPHLKIKVFKTGETVLPPAGNALNFIFREVLAFYRLACFRYNWLHQLVLYGVIGLLAAAVDYGIFALLTYFRILAPEFASLTGNICGFFFTFSGNTFYNFKKSDHVLFRFVSYLVIAAGDMTLSTLTIRFAQKYFNVYLLKAMLTLIVIPAIQFILNKKITYRNFKK